MTDGIKELDRSKGFYVRNYTGVKIVMEKYPENWLTRKYAIWAIRHPNKVIPTMDNASQWIPLFRDIPGWQVEVIPTVENPDPAQLEKLKEIFAGGLGARIKEYMMKEGKEWQE